MTMSTMSDNSVGSDDNSIEKCDDGSRRYDDICRDFLRNVCQRGKRCRYRHPDQSEARELGKRTEYTFCHDFQNSGCRRPNCKFIHCTRDEEDYYKQTGQLPVRLQQAAALGIGVPPSELPILRGEVPICKDFLKGECKRAARCKYRHLSASEYQYELGRTDLTATTGVTATVTPRPITNGITLATTFPEYYDEKYEYDPLPLKRRRIDLEEIENHYQPANTGYRIHTASDFALLEEENNMLRRKVEELKKQVSDLAATNEVLLEQNARFRVTKANGINALQAPPIATVSQVVTPTITQVAANARPTLTNPILNPMTSMATITLTNRELVVSERLPARIAQELSANGLTQTITTPVSMTPQTIVPVSIMDSMGGPVSSVTLAQNHHPAAAQTSLTQNLISGPTSLVSYPIMTATQLPSSLG